MTGRGCEDCEFFKEAPEDRPRIDGWCRRYPPSWNTFGNAEEIESGADFPIVGKTSWCGEWASKDGGPKAGRIEVVNLAPGDTIVLRCEEYLSEEQAERLRAEMQRRFPGRRCLVLEHGLELAAIREVKE